MAIAKSRDVKLNKRPTRRGRGFGSGRTHPADLQPEEAARSIMFIFNGFGWQEAEDTASLTSSLLNSSHPGTIGQYLSQYNLQPRGLACLVLEKKKTICPSKKKKTVKKMKKSKDLAKKMFL